MNKTSKGVLAAGAAAVLLIGGAGTLASWSDSESVDAGTITAGELSLEPGADGATWTDTHDNAAIPDIGNFLVVPGDNLVYEAKFTVRAEGDNLEATLEVDNATITGDLLNEADVNVRVADSSGNPLPSITEAQDGEIITARVTFDFPFEPATNASQTDTADLTGLAIKLEQTPIV